MCTETASHQQSTCIIIILLFLLRHFGGGGGGGGGGVGGGWVVGGGGCGGGGGGGGGVCVCVCVCARARARARVFVVCVCDWLCVCVFRGVSHTFNISSHQLKTQVTISQINSCNTFLDTTQSTANATKSKAVSNTISQHLHRIHYEDSAKARHIFKITSK